MSNHFMQMGVRREEPKVCMFVVMNSSIGEGIVGNLLLGYIGVLFAKP